MGFKKNSLLLSENDHSKPPNVGIEPGTFGFIELTFDTLIGSMILSKNPQFLPNNYETLSK